ncbi:acyl--CoA ligase [Plantactinospora sp. S1510]|uniref:Acyl--CoA ligase n=1 Tax=Plantactinospora alkalitolerans TaxID=2789879 RepID=A0ABS0GRL9_9ACTN|nr:class I adenylate-forming enzyme family protein [Plantactinospora alkalitolerans]MBF9128547.1 acyl--CoA ligase [Plantactinospora alkalitolerans]
MTPTARVSGDAGELLALAVARWPDAPAVRDPESGTVTYRQLLHRVTATEHWLRDQGVGPGARLAVVAHSRSATVLLLWATIRIGAVFVPLNPAAPAAALKAMITDAEPSMIVGGPETISGSTAARWVDWPEIEGAAAGTARSTWPPETPAPHSDDLCMLLYTSGTTAVPKGVMCPHRSVRFAVEAIWQRLRYTAEDIIFNRLPLSFDYGLYQALLAARAGACLVLAGPGNDTILLRRIGDSGATVLPLLPTLGSMIERLRRRSGPITGVRLITNTGAAMPERLRTSLREIFPSARLSLMYGITECKRVTIMDPDGDLVRPRSAGRPLDGLDVQVKDADGNSLPPMAVGELYVRGPSVMAGYWRDEEQTESRFVPCAGTSERMLRTGDFGYLDQDGYLYFEGRRDDIFKHNGARMNSLEIESAAQQVPGVELAALLIPSGDDEPMVLVVTGDSVDPPSVLSAMRRHLEQVKTPEICVAVSELPMTPNGKIDKAKLRESCAAHHLPTGGGR